MTRCDLEGKVYCRALDTFTNRSSFKVVKPPSSAAHALLLQTFEPEGHFSFVLSDSLTCFCMTCLGFFKLRLRSRLLDAKKNKNGTPSVFLTWLFLLTLFCVSFYQVGMKERGLGNRFSCRWRYWNDCPWFIYKESLYLNESQAHAVASRTPLEGRRGVRWGGE